MTRQDDAARLVHFTHNAEFLGEYPNLPAWISRMLVYAVWCGLSSVGLVGYLLARRGQRRAGLIALGLYGLSGFAALLHFVVAPMSERPA